MGLGVNDHNDAVLIRSSGNGVQGAVSRRNFRGSSGSTLDGRRGFRPRSNSLNLLRLVLAAMVVFSHSITLGGYGVEYVLHWTTFGHARCVLLLRHKRVPDRPQRRRACLRPVRVAPRPAHPAGILGVPRGGRIRLRMARLAPLRPRLRILLFRAGTIQSPQVRHPQCIPEDDPAHRGRNTPRRAISVRVERFDVDALLRVHLLPVGRGSWPGRRTTGPSRGGHSGCCCLGTPGGRDRRS